MKSKRQEKIIELISEYEIETQEDLLRHLRYNGYHVTQATVSRDIRELKLAKSLSASGTYCYALPKQSENIMATKYSKTLVESVLSVDSAQNIVVLKTYPGLAQAIALGIDTMGISKILGTIGGDDTVLVITRDIEFAKDIVLKIKALMRTSH